MQRIWQELRSVPWHTWLLIFAGLVGLYLTWRVFRNSQGGNNSVATNPNWAGLGANQTAQGDLLLGNLQAVQQLLAQALAQPPASSSSGGSKSSGGSSSSTAKSSGSSTTAAGVAAFTSGAPTGVPAKTAAHAATAVTHPAATLPATTAHVPHAIPYTHNAYSVPETGPVVPIPVLAHGHVEY